MTTLLLGVLTGLLFGFILHLIDMREAKSKAKKRRQFQRNGKEAR